MQGTVAGHVRGHLPACGAAAQVLGLLKVLKDFLPSSIREMVTSVNRVYERFSEEFDSSAAGYY